MQASIMAVRSFIERDPAYSFVTARLLLQATFEEVIGKSVDLSERVDAYRDYLPVYLETGIDVVGKGKEYGKKLADEYTDKNYHRPSDEIDASWTLEGAIKDLKLLFQVGKRLAFQEKWPEWKDGSEFKALRKK